MPGKTLKFEDRVLAAMKKKNKKATMKTVKRRLEQLLKSIEDSKSTFN